MEDLMQLANKIKELLEETKGVVEVIPSDDEVVIYKGSCKKLLSLGWASYTDDIEIKIRDLSKITT